VRNPLRSEAEAFRFVVIVLGFFAAVILGKLAAGWWVGLAVAAVGFVVLLLLLREASKPPERQEAPAHVGGATDLRILVIANETVGGGTLREVIAQKAEGYDEEVLVVCPALNSPLRHWVSDEDGARAQAQERLDESVGRLREAGVNVSGEIGDADPLQAIEDALRTFGADEVIVSTHPVGRSHWLERNVVGTARERFAVPITHVIVDLEADSAEVVD
jgi:nucleotide-binding universal stress UspA family protein